MKDIFVFIKAKIGMKTKIICLSMLLFFIPPHQARKGKDIGLCSLVCHKYVDMYIVSVISFFHQIHRNLPIFLINDGSLTEYDIRKLNRYFTVIHPDERSLIKKYPTTFPYFHAYRTSEKTGVCKKKFDAYLWNPFKRFIAFDSDILFYRTPSAILDFIEGKTTKKVYFGGRDASVFDQYQDLMGYEYTFRKLLFNHKKHSFDVSFNSGLMCVQTHAVFDLKKIEGIFAFFAKIAYTEYGMADETALCLLFQRNQTYMLDPHRYMMCSTHEEYRGRDKTNAVAIHYMGLDGLKNQFYTDAIQLILAQHFFHSDISIGIT